MFESILIAIILLLTLLNTYRIAFTLRTLQNMHIEILSQETRQIRRTLKILDYIDTFERRNFNKKEVPDPDLNEGRTDVY